MERRWATTGKCLDLVMNGAEYLGKPSTLAAVAVCCATFVLGCGKPEPSEVVVKGKVVFPGNSQKFLMVRFHPSGSARDSRTYDAALDTDRAFTLKCPKGSYRATLAVVPAHGGAAEKTKTPASGKEHSIPAKYQNPQTSWEVEIPEGGKSDLVLTVAE